jgi:hypothetical protein
MKRELEREEGVEWNQKERQVLWYREGGEGEGGEGEEGEGEGEAFCYT